MGQFQSGGGRDTNVAYESPFRARMREQLRKVAELRGRIRHADENVSDWEVRDLWDEAQFELGRVRLFGDLVVAAFFEGEKTADRNRKRSEYLATIVRDDVEAHSRRLEDWRHADRPLAPFHWEIEFPEVFDRAKPGFDAFVGNPPFLGGKRISTTLGESFRDWLAAVHPKSSSNTDLVAHFFRRAFNLARDGGVFGLIATNTIAQGDTRASGLRWICMYGGEIFAARRRVQWPGRAAVVVSVVHVSKGRFPGMPALDGAPVQKITAFLFHRGDHDDPVRLKANTGMSYVGLFLRGMGFTFDDTDTKGVASPLVEMRRLVEQNPNNQEVLFPCIGGQEVNTSPTHMHKGTT